VSLTAEQAVAALQQSTHWPGLLHLEPGLEARLAEPERVWHLRQGQGQVELEAASGRMLRGSWPVKPGQARLQLALATSVAGLSVYSLAYAAKLPCLIAALNLAALLGGTPGALVSALLAALFLTLWGAYLLKFCSQSLMTALDTVHSGLQQFPDGAPWRQPLRLLAIAQGIYILDAGAAAMQRNMLSGPLIFGLATQAVLIGLCAYLLQSSRDPIALPRPRSPLQEVLGWCALWLVCFRFPEVAFFGAIPVTMLVMGRTMVGELWGGIRLNVHSQSLTEKLFWLSLSLMVFVSFGALLGHTLYWATRSLHPNGTGEDVAIQWWVAGATVGTLLALFTAPLGRVKLPLFLASTLYQALIGKFGALTALVGAIAVIFLQAFWRQPGRPRQALTDALTFGLAESAGRVVGASLGLFFLGLEGAAVGGALGERALGAMALIQADTAPMLPENP
jgi:hypothetical protein